MTETTAKSGAAGAPTTPVAEETAADNSGTPATGRAAVGRAAVPAEAASPKFTRAPGMNPPPEQPAEGAQAAPGATTPGSGAAAGSSGQSGSGVSPSGVSSGPGSPVAVAAPPVTGKAQVSAPPAGAPTTAGRPGSAAAATGTAPAAGRAAAGTSSVRTVGAPGAPGVAGAAAGSAAVGNARVNEAVRAARTSVTSGSGRGPRRARLNLKRIDPWSVMKFSFAVSLVLFIVVIVATSVLYLALDAMDVFQTVNTSLGDLISAGGGAEASTFKITAKGVIGTSALIGLVNVVLFTALATLGAFIYNVCADLVGGVELTLAERD
jgi:hypothetical protein